MEQFNNHLVEKADQEGYAIPAFNYSDIWEMEAIVEAAAEEHAAVYIATNMRVVETLGLPYLGALGRTAYDLTNGHIINHLDHSTSVELCKRAVDHGYMSVMIDASMCTLEENIERTAQVVEYAHKYGVVVEAEIGRILGRSVEGTYQDGDYLVQVKDAVKLAEATHVDTLAVGIGTAHGFYKETPKINLQRLQEVNQAVSIPLVLHGGTGVPFDTVRACIKGGMAKVNVGTQLHATYLKELSSQMEKNETTSISNVLNPVKAAINPIIREWIRVCNAQNRY